LVVAELAAEDIVEAGYGLQGKLTVVLLGLSTREMAGSSWHEVEHKLEFAFRQLACPVE
jgi:hypothetical protein